MTHDDPCNAALKPGQTLHGFTVIKACPIADIKAFYYELKHEASGASHIHISAKDRENTFSVAFKTVPSDSTGVAHILEHTALCGSARYPVRDPFFSMIKRSLNTFMNAFTASDWTMYPFATQNRKDFYNLMDVYLDAAFFPRIDELSFKQEGHRLEFEQAKEGEKEELTFKGVVYNEMKGAMSSPSQILGRALNKALMPETTYANNSGGDPEAIPDLTWEELKAFHARHYHPSNAYFFTYGDIPLADHLEVINTKVLSHFERIDPKTTVAPQPRWTEPRQVVEYYPADKEEGRDNRAQVSLVWLVTDILNTRETLAFSLLSQVLLGNAAAPLRKALIDSHLGSSLCDATGFDSDARDASFGCGLKETRPENADAIESLIFSSLAHIAEEGIAPELIDSAIHQMEIRRREISNTPYPYGIKLLLGLAGCWFHGGAPERLLLLDEDLEAIKHGVKEEGYFETLIRERLLKNPHRVRFTLAPDSSLAEQQARQEQEQLDAISQTMTEAQKAKIRSDTEKLKSLQEAEEDISSLPTLELEDIPTTIDSVKPESRGKGRLFRYPCATNSLLYYNGVLEAGSLDSTLIPLVPFFCSAIMKVGTREKNYEELTRAIAAHTGGMGLSPSSRRRYDENRSALPLIAINSKCLVRNRGAMFDLLTETLTQYRFTDLQRLRNLLLEYRAALESAVVQNGHSLAISLANRNFTDSLALSELWSGVGQIQYIKALTDKLVRGDASEEALAHIGDQLAQIGQAFLNQGNLRCALAGDDATLTLAEADQRALSQALPEGSSPLTFASVPANGLPVYEGWTTNSAVSFVASAFPVVSMGHEDAPALSIIGRLLRALYLHREIREKGGAYGAFAAYSAEEGTFSMGSYRDPHVVRTLSAYDEAARFITGTDYTNEDVKEAILQACSVIDRPETPAAAARKGFFRELVGFSDETRRAYKEGLLALNAEKIRKAALRYFPPEADLKSVVVISGADRLKGLTGRLDRELDIHTI
ncbi:insulinase family protein [Desulfoluna sp.]|uniref:insulinase family protein n=1 Tax=Desulfoluna sp. TaxID=2045199 RepID=UPI00262C71BE|nr:insulinase family protein [Desulfoluna sp.]